MKKQFVAIAAGLLVSLSASAHKEDFNMSQEAIQYVGSGVEATIGMKLVKDVLVNLKNGASCIDRSRDEQDDMEKFFKRDQNSITCVIQTAEGTAFILIDYATKGVTKTLVIAGKGLHEVGQVGREIAVDAAKDLKHVAKFTRKHLGVLSWPLALLPASLSTVELVGGGAIYALGESGYWITTEAAKRIDLVVENSMGIVKNASYTVTELATLEPGNSAHNFVAVAAGAVQYFPVLIEGQKDADFDRLVKGSKYSITVN